MNNLFTATAVICPLVLPFSCLVVKVGLLESNGLRTIEAGSRGELQTNK